MNKRQLKKANKHKPVHFMIRVKLRNGKIRNREWNMFRLHLYAKILTSSVQVSIPDIIIGARSPWPQQFSFSSPYGLSPSQSNNFFAGGHWNEGPGLLGSTFPYSPYSPYFAF